MKSAALLSALICPFASGAVVSIPPTGLGDFSLDIDSDGYAEFSNFAYSPEENQIGFLFHVDGIDLATTFPDEPFVGIRGDTFASTEALLASSMYTGDLVVPVGYTRLYDSIQGFARVDGSAPVFAEWMFGSLGAGSDDLRLLGMIVDATEFFSSGQTSNLRIYFHDYGSYGGGDEIVAASLGQTGIGTGVPGQLDADVEFIGLKSGLIHVPSKLGCSYRLKRGETPVKGQTIATLIGTGEILTLSWDDSASTDMRAFFWVEEASP